MRNVAAKQVIKFLGNEMIRPSLRRRTNRFAPAVTVCLAFMSTYMFSQSADIRFKHLRIEDGLSQSSVHAIAQDRIGFLWFGTEDGLNRYDGYTFTVYRHDPLDSFSISDNYITRLLTGKNGDLWIGTFSGGLNRYEVSTGRFITYRNRTNDSTSLSNDSVVGLFEGREGTLWVCTWRGGLCRLDSGASGFIRYKHDPNNPNTLASNIVTSVQEDANGNLWVGTWGGLTRIDRTQTQFTQYRHDPKDPGSITSDNIWSLYSENNGDIWLATHGGGLTRYDRATERFVRYLHKPGTKGSLSSNTVMSVLRDTRSILWVGTAAGGINRLEPDRGEFVQYKQDLGTSKGPADDNIYTIYEDGSGILWFGTSNGVSYYDRCAKSFHIYSHVPGDPQSLSHNTVRGVSESRDGGLWVGTNGGGLCYLDRRSNRFTRYRSRESNPLSPSGDHILSVLEQRNGTLWVGTDGMGLNRINPTTGSSVHYYHDPDKPQSISNNVVMVLYEDQEGTLWAGALEGGLNRFDPVRDAFIHYTSPEGPLKGSAVWSLFEDSKGNLWVGTWGMGVNKYDRKNNSVEWYVHDSSDPNSLSNNTIICIHEDREKRLWLGTHGGGLNLFDSSTRRFKSYTDKDGLPSNVVVGILSDEHGNLWLSTYKGISRFTPATGVFRNFDVSDGLQSNEFNQGAYCRAKDGSMYFGGVAGLDAFHPDLIVDNPFVPPVVLTGFKVFQVPASLPKPVFAVDNLALSYEENFFSFEFAALSYSSTDKNQYMYKLEGLEKDWVSAGSRRVAYYTNVPAGAYVFRVKGSNNDGLWNDKGASVAVMVAPPPWRTWWAYAVYVLALAAAVFGWRRYEITKIRRKERDQAAIREAHLQAEMAEQQKELEKQQTRMQIARDLHDEVGSTLSGITFFAQAMSEGERSELNGAKKFLSLITESSLHAKEAMNDIIWSIDPANDSWGTIIAKLQRYASDLFESKGIAHTIEMPPAEVAVDIDPRRRRNFWLLFKEIITNAAKHSKCTEVRVQLAVDGPQVRLTVEDNGVGFDPEKPATGQGLKNIKSRASLLDARVDVRTAPGSGTRWDVAFTV